MGHGKYWKSEKELNNKILLSINVKTQWYWAGILVWKETILVQIIFAKPVFQIKRVFTVFECMGNKDSFVSAQRLLKCARFEMSRQRVGAKESSVRYSLGVQPISFMLLCPRAWGYFFQMASICLTERKSSSCTC